MSDRGASRRGPTLADATLCAGLCGAAVAMAVSRRNPVLGLLVLPCVLGLLAPVRAVPTAWRAGAERLLWGTLALLVLFGTAWAVYPVLPEAAVKAVPLVAGLVLALLGAAGLAARLVWPVSRGALPAAVGMLVVASFDPFAPVRIPVVGAAVALLLHAALEGRRAAVVRVGVFGLGAAGAGAAVATLLPWAQPHVEQVVADLTNPTSAVTSATFASTSRLGDVEDVSLSSQVVLRMWSDTPRKLRARVLTDFDGTTWRAPKRDAQTALVPAGTPARELEGWLSTLPGRSFATPNRVLPMGGHRAKVILAGPQGGVLFAPARPVVVRLAGEPPRLGAGVLVPAESVEIYGVVSQAGDDGGEEGPSPETLAVPADTDRRIRDLAAALAAEATSPAGRIARTLADLGGRCQYSLHVGRFRTRQPVAEFLFEKKRGYCEYFASAAALLLRLQGVPARYVTGLSVREDDGQSDHYVVRGSSAHAWIDAYVPGRGWVEVDPTPAGQFAAVHPRLDPGGLAAAWERVQAAWAELSARLRSGDYGAAGAPVAGLLLLGLVLAAWRRRRRRGPGRAASEVPSTLTPEIRDLLARVDRLAARRGFPRPSWRAPLEHLAVLPEGALPPPLHDAARETVEACYRAWFGAAGLGSSEADGLRARLEGASRPSGAAR